MSYTKFVAIIPKWSTLPTCPSALLFIAFIHNCVLPCSNVGRIDALMFVKGLDEVSVAGVLGVWGGVLAGVIAGLRTDIRDGRSGWNASSY
jgi:hypothetical protein